MFIPASRLRGMNHMREVPDFDYGRAVRRDDLTFQSQGARCAAWHYRPDSPAPVPCVVIAHGFDGVREQRLDAYAERFAAAGLAVLVFDYRYIGSSDGEPRQLFDNKAQLDDWRAAIACARQLDGVDPERIALWGTSTSGGHVVQLAAEDARIAAVVAQVPFVDGFAQLLSTPVRQDRAPAVGGPQGPDRSGSSAATRCLIPAAGRPGTPCRRHQPGRAQRPRRDHPAASSTWRNEVVARFTLATALYRPGRSVAQACAARCSCASPTATCSCRPSRR